VQLEGYIADCVGEVPADCYAERVAVPCYEFDVEELARVELYAGQENEGGGGSVLRDGGEDVRGGEVG